MNCHEVGMEVARSGGRSRPARVRVLVFAALAVMAVCVRAQESEAKEGERAAIRVVNVAERLQGAFESIVTANLLSSFTGDSYASGSAKDKISQLAAGEGTTLSDLDLPAIAAAVAKKASDLTAPIFAQMGDIATDFDSLVANSRSRNTREVHQDCTTFPGDNRWINERTAFGHPHGARLVDQRSSAEFCSLFPSMQTYLAGIQDVPSVHLAEYGTPKGECMVYNLRNDEKFEIPPDYDVRAEDWYVEASSLRDDVVIVVSMPRSLKISMGQREAVELVEGVFNTTVSLLAADDYFQVIVSGYSNPCFSAQYLVVATEPNKVKAIRFLREQISRHMPMGESTIPAASRLAWKLLQDSERAGFSSNCSRSVIFMTDGLVADEEVVETLGVLDELQQV